MILDLLKKYKTPIIAVLLVWGFIAFIQYYAISPLREQTDELKKDILKREIENKKLKIELQKDSIFLIEQQIKIEAFEKEEQFYKDLKPKIKTKYENKKNDYTSLPVDKRRVIFSKYANE